MNKIYRVIYNKQTQTWTAVSEYAKASGKSSSASGVVGSVQEGIYTAVRFVYTLVMSGVLIATGQVAWGATVGDGVGTNAVVVHGTTVTNTEAKGQDSIALSTGAKVYSQSGIALGTNAVSGTDNDASIKNTIAVGNMARGTGGNAIAVGQNSTATGQSDLAIGDGASAIGAQGTALGVGSKVTGNGGTALGYINTASGWLSTAVGSTSTASGSKALAVGDSATASGGSSVAIGSSAKSTSVETIAVGKSANTGSSQYGIAIGSEAQLGGDDKNTAIAIGRKAQATNLDSNAIGRDATASGQTSLAVGVLSKAQGTASIAIGQNAETSTAQSGVAIGNAAKSIAENGTALGSQSIAGDYATALGSRAFAKSAHGVAVGTASVAGERGTAVGRYSAAHADSSVAVGSDAIAIAKQSSAFGSGTVVSGVGSGGWSNSVQSNNTLAGDRAVATRSVIGGTNNFAIGNTNLIGSQTTNSVALGNNIKLGATSATLTSTNTGNTNAANNRTDTVTFAGETALANAVAIGNESNVAGHQGVAVGYKSSAGTEDSVAIGNTAVANTSTGTIAVGKGATAQGTSSVAVGTGTKSTAQSSVAVGNKSNAAATNTVAIGESANATNSGNIAIGENAGKAHSSTTQGQNTVLIGVHAGSEAANNQGQVSVGWQAGQGTLQEFNAAVGHQAGQFVNGVNNVAMGKGAGSGTSTTQRLTVNNTVALGTNAKATVDNGVALGASSVADVASGKVGADPLSAQSDKNNSTWTSTHSAVSVGSGTTITRQITSVAAGTNDTDAVNVAQLKAAGFKLNATNAGGGESTSIADDKIQNGETVTFDAGKNIKLTHTEGKVSIATKDDVDFQSVLVGNVLIDGDTDVISGLADGEVSANSSDAVTGSQLHATNTTIAKGLNFGANDQSATNAPVNRQLGDTLNIKGAMADTTPSDDTSGENVITRTTADGINIELAKNAKFNSITTGNTKISNDGLSFVDSTGTAIDNSPSITETGINAGNQKITGVADGNIASGSKDAINGGQLFDVKNIAEAKLGSFTVGADNNGTDTGITIDKDNTRFDVVGKDKITTAVDDNKITVDLTNDAKTSLAKADTALQKVVSTNSNLTAITSGDTVTLNFSQDPAFNSVKIGDTTNNTTLTSTANGLDVGGDKITNVAKGDVSTTSKDAINGSQLHATNTKVDANTANITALQNQTFKLQANGDTATAVKAGDTVQFINGDNIEITRNGNDITVATAKDVNFDSVVVGGVIIDGANDTITGVSDGEVSANSSDAINGSQLHAHGEGVKNIIGGDTTYDPATGTYTNTDIGGTGKDNINDAISSINAKAGVKTVVSAGDGVTVEKTGSADAPNYKVSANTDNSTVQITGGKIAAKTTTLTTDTDGTAKAGDTTSLVTGDQVATAINKAGLSFSGDVKADSATDNKFTRTNQQETKIIGGQTDKTKLTDNNIGVVSNGTDTLTVKLAKDLADLSSVTTVGDNGAKTVQNANGITITPATTATNTTPVSLTATGLDNGKNKITNVADGVDGTDAVNVSQLKSKTATTPLTVNDGKVTAPAGAEETKLATAGDIANAINNSGFNLQANGDTKSLVKAGDTVQFINGDNIEITRNGNDITVATAKDVNFDSVLVGGVMIDGDTNVISGLADGEVSANSDDAITGSQLYNAQNTIANYFGGGASVGADGTFTAPTYTTKKADGSTYATPANNVGDALSNLNSYVNEGFKVLDNDGNTKATVRPQDQVQFVKGNGTTVTVENDTATGLTKIKYDVAIDDKTIKVGADGKLYANVTDTNSVTKLADGNTTTVKPATNGDETTYTVEVNKAQLEATPTDTANADKITVNTAGKVVKPTDNTKAGNSFVTADVLADVVNNTGFNLQANGDAKSLVKAGDTVQFINGDNIEITRSGNDITVATARDVDFDTIMVGDDVTIDSFGLRAGDVNISTTGINAGGNKVTGVANGDISNTSKDAINGSQLHNTADDIATIIGGNATVDDKGNVTASDIGGTGKDNINDAIKASKTTVSSNDSSIKVTKTTDKDTGADNYDVSVNAQSLAETAQLPVVYTDGAGNKVYKRGNKFYDDPTAGTEIDPADVIASMQSADGSLSKPVHLTNVNAGSQDTDAVNVSQLKPFAQALGTTINADGSIKAPEFVVTKTDGDTYAPVTTIQGALDNIGTELQKPLSFAGDSGTAITRKLGTEVNVKGGATGALTDNNIGVVSDGKDTLTVKLAEKINLGNAGSVTTGATTVNNAGITITNTDPAKNVSLTGNGLNNGGNKIVNVANGAVTANSQDAINGSQLRNTAGDIATIIGGNAKVDDEGNVTASNIGGTGKDNINDAISSINTKAGVKTVVSAGDGVTVNNTGSADAPNYKVSAKTDNVTTHIDTNGNIAVITGDMTVGNDGKANAQMPNSLATASDIANAINNSGFNLQANGDAKSLVKAGDTVQFINGDNIEITRNGNDITVATAKDVNFDSIKVGGDIVIDSVGVQVGDVNITTGGIDAGNTQITNLASGLNGKTLDDIKKDIEAGKTVAEASNAATIGDLAQVQNVVTNNITNITNIQNILGGDTVDNTKTTDVKAGDTLGTGANASTALINTANVLKDKDGKPILTTYNVAGQTEYIQNDVVQAINHMNDQGIKFFHTNDGITKPEDQAQNSIDSSASGAYATAIGYQSIASGAGAVALGNTYDKVQKDAIVSEVKDDKGTVVGYTQRTQATGKNAIAIGTGSQAQAENTIAIGTGNVVTGKNSGAIGDPSIINADGSYSVGNDNTVATGANDTFILGNNVKATVGNSVYLGDKSSSTGIHTTANGGTYTYAGANDANVAGVANSTTAPNTAPVGVVSVGTENGQTRQIQNVSAGVVSETSTDAINGSQLYDTHRAIGNVANYTTNLGNQLNNRINEVEDDANAGVSSAMAMAALPQAYLPGKSMLTGGMATYNGEGAVAVGLSKLSDNGRWVLKISGSADTQGNAGGAIGAGFHF